MRKLMFATKSWKNLQKDYIERDLCAFHTQKLDAILREDISGRSFEDAVIHYSAISTSAMLIGIAGYMQRGTFENAETYFYLASMAKRTSYQLLFANPHRRIAQGHKIPLDVVVLAALCGSVHVAIDILEATGTTYQHAQKSSFRSRRDQQQAERQTQRVLKELEFYKSLLQNKDEQAVSLLPSLEELSEPSIQVTRAFFAQDGEAFSEALTQHIKEFRSGPYPEELNFFVLLMEFLFQKRRSWAPLDYADAPAGLLALPECDPAQAEQKTRICFPTFDLETLLRVIEPEKTGPKFKQYTRL